MAKGRLAGSFPPLLSPNTHQPPMASERPPAELYYFAFHAKDWLSSRSVRRMSSAERGDFIDLLCLAWGNGMAEPSLESDDFGTASKRVKDQFSGRNGRFYNEKLSRVWGESQQRHSQAVRRGKASGKARRDRKRLQTVSKPSRNQVEQPPLDMGIESSKDSLSRGAGAPALASASPALPAAENSARREGGGMALVLDIMAGMGLKPKAAT